MRRAGKALRVPGRKRSYSCPECGDGPFKWRQLLNHCRSTGHKRASHQECFSGTHPSTQAAGVRSKKKRVRLGLGLEPGENKGRCSTGANSIVVPMSDDLQVHVMEESLPGCWTHPDELRGPQMTVPHWVGPTPLSSLPPGWHMEFDEPYRSPYFWHDDKPNDTIWEDPRRLVEGAGGPSSDVGSDESEREASMSGDDAEAPPVPKCWQLCEEFLSTAPPLPESSIQEAHAKAKARKIGAKGSNLHPHAHPQQQDCPRTLLQHPPWREPAEPTASGSPRKDTTPGVQSAQVAKGSRESQGSYVHFRSRSLHLWMQPQSPHLRVRPPSPHLARRPQSPRRSSGRFANLSNGEVLREIGLDRAAQLLLDEDLLSRRRSSGRGDSSMADGPAGISLRILLVAVEEALCLSTGRARLEMRTQLADALAEQQAHRRPPPRSCGSTALSRR